MGLDGGTRHEGQQKNRGAWWRSREGHQRAAVRASTGSSVTASARRGLGRRGGGTGAGAGVAVQ